MSVAAADSSTVPPMNSLQSTPSIKAKAGLLDRAISYSRPRKTAGALDCHICLDAPIDAVATSCGHIFCWPCIAPLFHIKGRGQPKTNCPVCHTGLGVHTNLLPVYGGASSADSCSASRSSDSPALPPALRPRPRNPCKFIPRVPGTGGACPELAGYAGALLHVKKALAWRKARNDCLAATSAIEQRCFEADMEELQKEQQQLAEEERLLIRKEEELELELELQLELQRARIREEEELEVELELQRALIRVEEELELELELQRALG